MMTPDDPKFLFGCMLGGFLTAVILDWLAECRAKKIEREGIDKWLKR